MRSQVSRLEGWMVRNNKGVVCPLSPFLACCLDFGMGWEKKVGEGEGEERNRGSSGNGEARIGASWWSGLFVRRGWWKMGRVGSKENHLHLHLVPTVPIR